MLKTAGRNYILSIRSRCCLKTNSHSFSSSPTVSSAHPNPPLTLDLGMQALLKDVDISLVNFKDQSLAPPQELEIFPRELEDESKELAFSEEVEEITELRRKSPAAHFGSQQIGSVVLPTQLQSSINLLIADADKPQLRTDAKRLFSSDNFDNEWQSNYDIKYNTRRQAAYHAERDGTAFASVALPAHYSAIMSILDHVKRRLEPSWKIEQVLDWGAGTGSGLWASLYSFQEESTLVKEHDIQNLDAADSTLRTYVAIDKRDGLVSIGKRLLCHAKLHNFTTTWQRSFKEDDKIPRNEGQNTLAISAFMLTSLHTPLARKQLVKEMWESGAHTIILIDHNTTSGFEAIARAREDLLNMGRKETQDPEAEYWPIRGSHVLAPCPHDGACPLYRPGRSRLICGFSQRLQRPAFVRRTKHSGVGYEDVEYSYVVIRRGSRPSPATSKFGRMGEVGKRNIERKSQAETKELQEFVIPNDADPFELGETVTTSTSDDLKSSLESTEPEGSLLYAALRHEAYHWPRLVFPPLKKSGHIILDSCTAEGKIMRLTIPKSQGKQHFYDARKSSWGDIFPHQPKNAPQERQIPIRSHKEATPLKGADIGKRGRPKAPEDRPSTRRFRRV